MMKGLAFMGPVAVERIEAEGGPSGQAEEIQPLAPDLLDPIEELRKAMAAIY